MSETPSIFGPRNLPNVRSAIQFANATNTPDSDGRQGATMNPYTYEVAEVGKTQGHAVGGVRKADGTGRINTTYIDAGHENPKITPAQVLKMADHVKTESGNDPKVHLGSWVENRYKSTKRKGVQVDASEVFPADTSPKFIRGLLEQRNEKESFNIGDPDSSVRNHKWRKYNGQQ